MFSKDTLRGIFLSHPKAETIVSKDANTSLGYRTRLRISLRGKEDFLYAVQRSLLQHSIESKLLLSESKDRPRPVLRITGIENLRKMLDSFKLENGNIDWYTFDEILKMVENGEHLTSKGFDKILTVKGAI